MEKRKEKERERVNGGRSVAGGEGDGGSEGMEGDRIGETN